MHSFKLFKNHFRQYLKISFFLFSFLILFCFGFNNLYAATYYVCTTGNDNNPGTESKPFKTLQRAHTAVSAGDTVIVEDGTYTTGTTGTYNSILRVTKAGTSSNWITFKARNQHQAILDGINYDDVFSIVTISPTAAYIKVDGFTIKRGRHRGVGVIHNSSAGEGAHNIEIINNKIHDIGQAIFNHTYGITGIKTDPLTRNVLIKGNIIYDIGRLPGGNYPDGRGYHHDYAHDHGWYAQGKGLIFRNNLVYNCKAGFGIKIDGHWSLNELGPDEFTHIIENNFFKPLPQQGAVGGFVRPFNNRSWHDTYGRLKNPRYILDNNYFYGDPSGLGYSVRITERYGNSNVQGVVMQNNVSSAAHLYEPDPGITQNITAKNNTVNAPDSMFKMDITNPLTPPSVSVSTN